MSARRLTRRSLLASIAAAVAGGIVRPRGVLAALAGPSRPVLEEHWLGWLGPGGATVRLGRVADLLGVEWQTPAVAAVELRFRDADGNWSQWVSAGEHGHGPEAPFAEGRHVGDPVWTGGTTVVQVRAGRTLSGVRLHLVDVSDGVGARRQVALASTATLVLATPVLKAGAGQPPIIARRAWAQGISPPARAPEYGVVSMGFVHHTDNPNGYGSGEVPAMLRAIYVFHRFVNGWNDIGYNFVIDSYGRIFEARAGGIDEPVVGAHAGGYNMVSSGVAVLGTFTSVAISPAARSALEELLAWKLSLHGVPSQGRVVVKVNPAGASYSRYPANARVPLPRIVGHRDADTTDCPGNVLYGELPTIRTGVRGLAPNPTRATLALLTPAATPGAPPPPTTPGAPAAPTTPEPVGAPGTGPAQVLAGALELLDGTPLVGAPVLIQARTVSHKGEVVNERTLAETTTDSEGKWELDAAPITPAAGGMWLRALCPGGPGLGAGISEPLHLAKGVSFTAPAANP
ncbi:MAG TPA: N-acetylmuramoyl-L-alanine amidase [Solirubrobacteraceae bacterium]